VLPRYAAPSAFPGSRAAGIAGDPAAAGGAPAPVPGAGADRAQPALLFLGLATLGGNEPTWILAFSTQSAARPGSSRQAPGRLR